MADEEKKQAPATTEPPAAEQPAQPAQAAAPAAPQAPPQRPRMGDRGPRPGGDRGPRPGGDRGPRKFFRRKKVCKFCVEKIDSINYKDVRLLSQFVAERGKIVPRRLTGVCTPHQRRLTAAIKQARNIALLPFAAR
jgi:small subunit ribosomal protein S18